MRERGMRADLGKWVWFRERERERGWEGFLLGILGESVCVNEKR